MLIQNGGLKSSQLGPENTLSRESADIVNSIESCTESASASSIMYLNLPYVHDEIELTFKYLLACDFPRNGTVSKAHTLMSETCSCSDFGTP